jgi:acyl-CoA dehydrogenase
MDFAFSPRVQDLQAQVQRFMDDLVLPSNRDWQRYADAGYYPSDVVEPLKAQARAAGLWNLFLPDLRDDEPGTRLSNLEYAPLAEIMGRVPWASEVFNCSAPDTGNIELLHLAATPEQARQWMAPLLEGAIRSCFAMSEPDVASSDATNICTRIQRDGDDYVINGRKWFITGALHPACRLAIVMGVSNDAADAPAHQRHSMILVPMDAPGVEIVRNMPVMAHLAIDGHCEMACTTCACPPLRCWAQRGQGFAHGAGAPGAGSGAPLHAHHRPVRAGAGTDVQSAHWSAWPSGGTAVRLCQCAGLDRPTAGWRSTRPACWCCAPPG